MNTTQKRTAKDPQAWVDSMQGRTWGGKPLKVTLISIDGQTAKGWKRFTVQIENQA